MIQFIGRRVLFMIPTLIAISMVSFIIIQLPPGDWLTSYAANLAAHGQEADQAVLEGLRERYGLGEPVYIQYLKWVNGVLHGDFGHSYSWKVPVASLIWSRLALTFVVSLGALLFTWVVAFPIGIYSAVKQYSIGDYVFTFFGFLGVAVPDFLLALVLMVISFLLFSQSPGGLFSDQFQEAPWSLARVIDLLKHIWVPMVVLGISHAASLIRIMRANLLDELQKPYVTTARAKGQREWKLIMRYPVRAALNPFVSTVGWTLAGLVSGATVVAVVLNLPTNGPLLLDALISQDMFLAGAFILMLSVLTVIGTLVSDILLAWLDPRVRLSSKS